MGELNLKEDTQIEIAEEIANNVLKFIEFLTLNLQAEVILS